MKLVLFFLFIFSICIYAQDDSYLAFAEEMPQVVGGLEMLYVHLDYPEKAKKDGIEGKVYLLVYLNEKAGVDNIKVIKAPSPELGESAIKAAKEVKYTAGKNGGVPVKVKMSLCIVFKLKK